MAKTSRGGRRGTALNSVTQTAPAGTQSAKSSGRYVQMTDKMAQDLRDDVDDRYNINVRSALKIYTSDATDRNGYSWAQNLNYDLDNGNKLDENEQYMLKTIQSGMHNIGNDVVLTRACHDDILKSLGISNYQSMTDKQLQQALVGATYKTKSFSSFSYDDNKNPFLSGSQAGGREVIIRAKTGKDTQVVFGAKSQSEIITNIGTNYKINNVYFNGKTATPRNGGTKKQVVIEVETI